MYKPEPIGFAIVICMATQGKTTLKNGMIECGVDTKLGWMGKRI